MEQYIVLLKGVNVSGKNIIKMALLKDALTKTGFTNVTTYIQSGNIVLQSNLTAPQIQDTINQLIYTEFQLQIAIFCLTTAQIKQALQNNPFPESAPGNKVFITFLKDTLTTDALLQIEQTNWSNDKVVIINNVLYFYLVEGMGQSKLNNNFFERKLHTTATGRNLNTLNKLVAMV